MSKSSVNQQTRHEWKVKRSYRWGIYQLSSHSCIGESTLHRYAAVVSVDNDQIFNPFLWLSTHVSFYVNTVQLDDDDGTECSMGWCG